MQCEECTTVRLGHAAERDPWKEKIDPTAIVKSSYSVYADNKGRRSCEAEMLACGSELCEVGKGRSRYMDANFIPMRDGFFKFAIDRRSLQLPRRLRLSCSPPIGRRDTLRPSSRSAAYWLELDIAVEHNLRH